MLSLLIQTCRRRKCKGSVLVEFAVVSVLLLLLVLGIIDFGMMFKNYLTINHIAREAARSASLGTADSAVQSKITSWAADLGLTTSRLTSSITHQTVSSTESYVTVTLHYNYQLITGSFLTTIAGVSNPINMRAAMVMRKN